MIRRPRRRTLLISENAPVPADRRVWHEARTLRDAGWEVVVACAADPAGQPSFELLDGIAVHRYELRPADGGAADYVREYAQAGWRLRRLVRRLAAEQPFDIVHAANPPDFLLATALEQRRRGARFVFDHHDLMPELFRSRFASAAGHRAALLGERLAFRLADVVVCTNESYRRIAIGRGRRDPQDVFVVRNGPDLTRFAPVQPEPALRNGRSHLLAYLGIMGAQDGIDHAIRALAALHEEHQDWHAVFVGSGSVVEEMRCLAAALGIAERVEFAGWRGDDDIRRILSTADVCLAPDPPSPLNDASTMMKIPEYMAMGRPVVSYDLPESRVSAGDAAVYADSADPASFGRALGALLRDPARRERMSAEGLRRAHQSLGWQFSAPVLCEAYERALAKRSTARWA